MTNEWDCHSKSQFYVEFRESSLWTVNDCFRFGRGAWVLGAAASGRLANNSFLGEKFISERNNRLIILCEGENKNSRTITDRIHSFRATNLQSKFRCYRFCVALATTPSCITLFIFIQSRVPLMAKAKRHPPQRNGMYQRIAVQASHISSINWKEHNIL